MRYAVTVTGRPRLFAANVELLGMVGEVFGKEPVT